MQYDDWKHKMPWFERDSELRLPRLQVVAEREKECLCSFPFLTSKTVLTIVFVPFSPTRVFLRLRYGTHRLLSEAFSLYVGPGALADSRLITTSKKSSFLTGITLQARCRSCKMQVRTILGRKFRDCVSTLDFDIRSAPRNRHTTVSALSAILSEAACVHRGIAQVFHLRDCPAFVSKGPIERTLTQLLRLSRHAIGMLPTLSESERCSISHFVQITLLHRSWRHYSIVVGIVRITCMKHG
jgi:hypothetical protein